MTIANSYSTLSQARQFDKMEAIHVAEAVKFKKYQALCEAQDLVLCPFVCGSLGHFNDHAIRLMKQMGSAVSAACGLPRELVISNIRRRVSFAIQKAQASALLRRGLIAESLC